MIDSIIGGKTDDHDFRAHFGILQALGIAELLIAYEAVVAGGFWRTIVDGSNISDIDVFCISKTSAMEIIKGLELRGFEVIFKCPQGELHTMFDGKYAVQIISKDGCFTGDCQALIDSFDFTACMFAVSSDLTSVFFGETTIHDAKNKLININAITYAAHSMRRSYKYVGKGYEIRMKDVFEIVKLMATQENLTVDSFYKGGVD